jgi:hypothetical protein
MKTFREYLEESNTNVRAMKKLARQYHESLPSEARPGHSEYKSGDIRGCTTGNCAWHAKNFIDFAKSKGVNAKAISMQNQSGGPDHIAARVGDTIVDPTHYQFSKKRPNSVGAHVTRMQDFDKHYGEHGYKRENTMTASIEKIENTPYEKGGAGQTLTYQAPRKK